MKNIIYLYSEISIYQIRNDEKKDYFKADCKRTRRFNIYRLKIIKKQPGNQ